MHVDDSGEQSLLLVGRGSPCHDILENVGICAEGVIEAGVVNKCDFGSGIVKDVRRDVRGTLNQMLTTQSTITSDGRTYMTGEFHQHGRLGGRIPP